MLYLQNIVIYFPNKVFIFALSFQNLSKSKLVEMPSYNLVEIVHNKWLQQSGNRGNDLCIATIDDYVRAFMQMVKYYQYLKGNQARIGPKKEELLFQVVQ